MGFVTVERNIEDELLNSRMSRRKTGHVPYPLKYSSAMASFDIWDHMFVSSCCDKSLTMHQFETPPKVVLDLGCGTGYWAIEAAKAWPESTIVGFDIAEIQPSLGSLRNYRPIASRVKWVHGNFLDGLPFIGEQFDFVRIVGIGLAVPEDEWQHLLEEVFRVMKPSAVVEIIEEDLLFPCATLPQRKSGFSPNSMVPQLDLTVPSSKSSTISSLSSSDDKTLLSPAGSINGAIHKSDFSIGSPPPSALTVNTYCESQASRDSEEELTYLQDHRRLKTAWESMLSSRFICSKPLSILPFYIASSSFVNVQSHSPCKIPLPPNSGTTRKSSFLQLDPMYDDPMLCVYSPAPSLNSVNCTVRDIGSRCQASSSSNAGMHLAKTVSIIKASKEAIWHEYAKLFPKGPSASVRFLTRSKAILSNTSSREAFEADWKNWENDMTDRIAMRSMVLSDLSWTEPKGEQPDWRVWRSHLEAEKSSPDSGYASLDGDSSQDLCRSLAGFVGWKPN